jgi:N-acetylglucosaminyldiphosphoundecaprenol N-acetyl-beta-D-mannosaminyltransferase
MFDLAKYKRNILDVGVYAVTSKEALQWASDVMETDAPHLVATANAEMLMMAHKNESFRDLLNRCDLVVPDGAGVLWAGDQLGISFPERVTGADFSKDLLLLSQKKKYPVYLLGGAPGVAAKAADHFIKHYGPLTIAGIHDGYFNREEEKDIIEEIRKNHTKLLLVGLGVPKQEEWLSNHKDELGPVLAMGIGGVFDVMCGNLKRAPLWMQHHRLEWAYRLYLQPSRIGRMMALPKFMSAVKKWKKNRGSEC